MCGDGFVSGSEECDDGNIFSGDGCDMNCQFENGACCNGETCTLEAEADCTGTFYGAGSVCDEDEDGFNVCVDCDDTNSNVAGVTLSLLKIITNDDQGTLLPNDFTLTATAVSGGAVTFSGDGQVVDPNAPVQLPAAWSLSETLSEGYDAGLWACTGGVVAQTGEGAATLTTSANECGASITCQITNDDLPRGSCCAPNMGGDPIRTCTDLVLESDCQQTAAVWVEDGNCLSASCCGDGVINGDSQCDDGNMAIGDGCDMACQCETPSFSLSVTSSVNSYSSAGEIIVFTATITNTAGPVTLDLVQASITTGPQTCSPVCDSTTLAIGGSTQCSCSVSVALADLGSGEIIEAQFVVRAISAVPGCGDEFQQLTDSDIAAYSPLCGNGFLDIGEECDDGNTAGGDGCTALCEIANCCTYTQGFWKNIERPPLSASLSNLANDLPEFAQCASVCDGLHLQCLSLGGDCMALKDACLEICNDPEGTHDIAYPRRSRDATACTRFAGHFWAAILNLIAGGVQDACDPAGASIPDSVVAELAAISDGDLLSIFSCVETAQNRAELLDLARLLDSYNTGEIGPGHCESEVECAFVRAHLDGVCPGGTSLDGVSRSGKCTEIGGVEFRVLCRDSDVHEFRVSDKSRCRGQPTDTPMAEGQCTPLVVPGAGSLIGQVSCGGCPDFELQSADVQSDGTHRTLILVITFSILGALLVGIIIYTCLNRPEMQVDRQMGVSNLGDHLQYNGYKRL